MRYTRHQVDRVVAGYILEVDVIGVDEREFYVAGDRQNYAALLCAHTGRPDVLQVFSRRVAPASTVGKATPTPVIAEDFGCMAGYWWSGDEFALDGKGEEA
jgi:hypothetical protein